MKKLKRLFFALTMALISACGSVGTSTPVTTITPEFGTATLEITATSEEISTVTPEPQASVLNFQIYDVNLGKEIYQIQNGDALNLEGVNYTIKINTLPQVVDKVDFYLNGVLSRTERGWPYALSNNEVINDKETYEPLFLAAGNYNLEVVLFYNEKQTRTSINFSIVQIPTQTPSQQVILNANHNFVSTYNKTYEDVWPKQNTDLVLQLPNNWVHTFSDGQYVQEIDAIPDGLKIYYTLAQGLTTLKQDFVLSQSLNVNLEVNYKWEVFGIETYDPERLIFKIYLDDVLLNSNLNESGYLDYYASNNYFDSKRIYNLNLDAGLHTIKLEFETDGVPAGVLYLREVKVTR